MPGRDSGDQVHNVKKNTTPSFDILRLQGHAQTCDNPPLGCGDRPWDFYNVSDFIHGTLGCDYIMLYMPLLAYNEQHGYVAAGRTASVFSTIT